MATRKRLTASTLLATSQSDRSRVAATADLSKSVSAAILNVDPDHPSVGKVASIIAAAVDNPTNLVRASRLLSGRKLSQDDLYVAATKATVIAEAMLTTAGSSPEDSDPTKSNLEDATVESAARKLLNAGLHHPEMLDTCYDLVAAHRPEIVALTNETPAGQSAPTPDLPTEEGEEPKSAGAGEVVKVNQAPPNQAVVDVLTNENSTSQNLTAATGLMTKIKKYAALLSGDERVAAKTTLEDAKAIQAAVSEMPGLKLHADALVAAVTTNRRKSARRSLHDLFAGLKTLIAGFNLMTEMDITPTKPAGYTNPTGRGAAKTAAEAKDEKDPEDGDSEKTAAGADELSNPDDGDLPEGDKDDESEPHFPGETPVEHKEHEDGETPEEEEAEHEDGKGEDEEDDDSKDEDDDEDDDEDEDAEGDDDDVLFDDTDDSGLDLDDQDQKQPGIDDLQGLEGVDTALQDSAPAGGPPQGVPMGAPAGGSPQGGVPQGPPQGDDQQMFGSDEPAPAEMGATASKTAGRSQQQLPRGTRTASRAAQASSQFDDLFNVSAADSALVEQTFRD